MEIKPGNKDYFREIFDRNRMVFGIPNDQQLLHRRAS
jgi:hypothetical protein